MGYLERNRVHVGDVRELAGRMEPASVQCIVTSPPYYGLRDYGTGRWEGGDAACDHQGPPKRTQAGFNARYFGKPSEESDKQGEVREPYRGSCGKCGAVRVDQQLGLEPTPAAYVANLVAVFRALRPALKDDGCLWLNLGDSYSGQPGGPQGATGDRATRTFTGEMDGGRRATGYPNKCLLGIPWRVAFALIDDGWILRSDIIWAKPAPMPESVRDRPTRSHEYLFLLSKKPAYYYDAEAIREKGEKPPGANGDFGNKDAAARGVRELTGNMRPGVGYEVSGYRNKRSVWTVTSAAFPDAHYATFPPDLIRPCVLAGSRPGDVVLDPFMGSGTTAQVAHEEGRRWIGIDLDERAVGWTRDRLAKYPIGRLAGM